jgi:putative membrane protein
MKKHAHIAAIAATVGLFCTAFAFADMSAEDVLNALHQADRMEIHMGTLAQEKGSTGDVQSYGKMLASDHQDNDKKVTDLAAKEGITLKSAKPGMMDKMEMKHLKSLSGSDFDRTFAKKMIDGHQKNIALLQSASTQKTPLPNDVRQLMGDTLPTLQKHLETAQKIYGQPS